MIVWVEAAEPLPYKIKSDVANYRKGGRKQVLFGLPLFFFSNPHNWSKNCIVVYEQGNN